MKHLAPKSGLVLLGTLLIFAMVSISIDKAYGISEEEVNVELAKIESKLQNLNDLSFDINTVGNDSFELKSLSQSLLKLQNGDSVKLSPSLKEKISQLKTDYDSKLTSYKKQAEAFEKENKDLISQKRLMISDIKKLQTDYSAKSENIKQKDDVKSLIKDTVTKVENEKKFQNLINDIAINQADKSKYVKLPDNIANLALEEVTKNKDWGLLPSALDRMIQKYPQPELKSTLQNVKSKVVTALKTIESTDTSIQALKSVDTDIPDFSTTNNVFEITSVASLEEIIKESLDEVKTQTSDYDAEVQEIQNEISPYSDSTQSSATFSTSSTSEDSSGGDSGSSSGGDSGSSSGGDSGSSSGGDSSSDKAAEKAEKEAKKAEEKAAKEAQKAAEKAEKEAKKAEEKAAKEAQKAADKAAKEAQKAAEKESKK